MKANIKLDRNRHTLLLLYVLKLQSVGIRSQLSAILASMGHDDYLPELPKPEARCLTLEII